MENMQKPVVSPATMQAPFPSVMSAQSMPHAMSPVMPQAMPQTMTVSNMPHQLSPAYNHAPIKQMPVMGAYDHGPHHHPHSNIGFILVLYILLVIISIGKH